MIKEAAINICYKKMDFIKRAEIAEDSLFGILYKLGKLKHEIIETNYRTAAQQLGLQDALKLIHCVENGIYTTLPGDTFEERCINFVLDQEIESGILDCLSSGRERLRLAETDSVENISGPGTTLEDTPLYTGTLRTFGVLDSIRNLFGSSEEIRLAGDVEQDHNQQSFCSSEWLCCTNRA